MDKIIKGALWCAANLGTVLAYAAALAASLLSLVGTVKNIMTQIEKSTGRQYPKADSKLAAVADMLAFVAKYGHKGVIGPVSLPGVPSVPGSGNVDVARLLLPWAVGLTLGIALSGCAVTGLPKDASLAQKLKADASAFALVCKDVGDKCGPDLVAFVKTVNDGIAAAQDYADLLADVAHAARLYADGKMDVAAVECVISTIRQDFRALSPKKAEMLDRLIADLHSGVFYAELETPPLCEYVSDDAPACRPTTVDNDDVELPAPRAENPDAGAL